MKLAEKVIFVALSLSFLIAGCQSAVKIENSSVAGNNSAANNASSGNKPELVKNINSSSSANSNSPPSATTETAEEDDNFTKLFSGKIGDDDDEEGKSKIPPFQMRLKRSGSKLSGTYRYKNSTRDILLQGTIDEDNNFVLTESINNQETGKFDGSLENNGEGLLKMSGVWSKPKSEDNLGFAADEIPLEMTGEVYLDDKSLIEKNNRLDLTINYPQITGAKSPNEAKLNQALKNIALQYQSSAGKSAPRTGGKLSLEVNYTIHLATDDLFSIEFTSETDSGGAHPNHNTKTLNYDLRSGKPIGLADLFKPEADYLEKFSAISLAKIKADLGDGIFEEGIKPVPKNYQNWVIQKDGLLIYFDEYQAAPYTSGRQEVLIEFAEIKDLLNSGSVVAALAK